MTYNKSTLTNIRSFPYPFHISLPNGEVGEVCLSPVLTLPLVFYVRSFKFNLISVHYFVFQLKGVASFYSVSCLLYGSSLMIPLELGRAKNVLYFLCSKYHNCCPSHYSNKKSHDSSNHCHTFSSLVKCNDLPAPSFLVK